jgi:predicted ATPase/class 3 adenylate cyclase
VDVSGRWVETEDGRAPHLTLATEPATVAAAPTLPSGLVTFVMTDIEGSTKMFRRLGDAYPPLLDAHNELLRAAWTAHRGVEVKTVGDSFIVAFESASDALAASVAAQRAVGGHPWPPDAIVRIRIGVHTGLAYPRDGDYVALALHQAARVESAANGGDVLASEDAVAAAGEGAGVGIEPLGAFRLRDFERPVRLAAVVEPGTSPRAAIAVRAVPAEGHNLVPTMTSFVGRADDVEAVERLVRPRVGVTILGPGGMGKTRLAMEVGRGLAPMWPDGVWFVDLSMVSDGRLVVGAVTAAIGEPAGADDEEADLLAQLAKRRSLLILDNCEHVVDSAAHLVDTIVARCPHVGVLATSRVPLNVPSEERWPIPPLHTHEAAVQLFRDRARSRAPDVLLTAADEPVIAEICSRLDGLPLAIELAAARVAVLSPAEILAGLDRRLTLLRSTDRTAAPRQRSMEALLDWGQALLTPDEQAVFRRLAVFRASFDLAAAASVGFDDVDPDDVPEVVWSLTDQSLLVVDRGAGKTRYRMLETIRAYAADRLRDSGETAAMRARLADFYLERFPWDGVSSKVTLGEIALEADTLAPLIDDLLGDGRSDDALALARLLSISRFVDGRLELALADLERVITRADLSSGMLARGHVGASHIAVRLAQFDRAEAHLREAVQCVADRGAADRWGHVSTARATADLALRGIADLAAVAEDLRRELDEPLSNFDRGAVLSSLGEVLGELGAPGAIDVLAQSAELSRQLGDDGALCASLSSLAEHELRRGATSSAARHQLEALRLGAEMATPILVAISFILAARMAEPAGSPDAAVRLHAIADVMLAEAGFTLMPSDQALSDAMYERARLALGDERYEAECAAGCELTLPQAIELAESVFTLVIEG